MNVIAMGAHILDVLLSLLARAGIDSSLVVRKTDVATSMSVLPIRPNGERPAFHLLGANLAYALDDIGGDAVAAADHIHLGGTEMLGPDFATRILKHTKENGLTTSVDLIAPAMAYTDYLLPNEDQVLGFTGAADIADGCRRLLDAGVGLLAVTCGAEGALVVSHEGTQQVPAFAVDVVDTTGCGDAFSAGFVYATRIGRAPRDAAFLANAVAALVAQGLGSDHGDFDLSAAALWPKWDLVGSQGLRVHETRTAAPLRRRAAFRSSGRLRHERGELFSPPDAPRPNIGVPYDI